MYNVAIIGCGRISHKIAEGIAKNKDRIKLKALTNSKGKNDFHYILGVYFEVDTTGNNNHIIEFFVNGKEYKKS